MSRETFEALKAVLAAKSEGMQVTEDGPNGYAVYTGRPIELAGRHLANAFFASVKEAKNDTALYFFPIYSHPKRFADLPASLRKKLTGKSCFHIKTADPELLDAVAAMFVRGREIYSDPAKT